MRMPMALLNLLQNCLHVRLSGFILVCTFVVLGIALILTLPHALHKFLTQFRHSQARRRPHLPPAPRTLPFLGNLHQLILSGQSLPHRALTQLSKRHGPLMCLRLGSRLALFVSNSAMAKEFFTANDRHFASRPTFMFCERLLYGHQNGIAFSKYGPRWRTMRRICTLELFTAKKISAFQKIAEEELALLVDDINLICAYSTDGFVEMNIANLAHLVVSNMMGRLVLSKRMCDTYSDTDDQSLLDMFKMTNDAIVPAMADFLPLLGPLLDFRARHNMNRVHKRLDAFWQAILHERRQSEHCNHPKDFLDVLLNNDDVAELGDENIKATLMDILGAGSETSAITLEWAMAELLRNPDCFMKLRAELSSACPAIEALHPSASWMHPISRSLWARSNVLTSSASALSVSQAAASPSTPCSHIKRSHIAGAAYLKAVLKETLRLHPPVPLLIPRASTEPHFGDLTWHKGTMLFVNAWAIGRDEEKWERAGEFRPERFDGGSSSFSWSRQTDFELLPFGAGRRRCPGMALSLCIMELTLATFVRAFEWELPNNSHLQMSMQEKSGSAGTHKAQPLVAILRPRLLAATHLGR